MKQNLLTKLRIAALALVATIGGGSAQAENTTITPTVKMTYVDGSNTTTAAGEVAEGHVGYNKISGGKVAYANTGWGVNYITYIQVDASSIPSGAIVTAATLSGTFTSCSGRTANWGVGFNASIWSAELTDATADKTITTLGSQQAGSGKGKADSKTFDIKAAFENDADNIVTLLVYDTNAGGTTVKDISASLTYTTDVVYAATFTLSDGSTPSVKVYSDEARTTLADAGALTPGTYYYTAALTGYAQYQGSFTVSNAAVSVQVPMVALTAPAAATIPAAALSSTSHLAEFAAAKTVTSFPGYNLWGQGCTYHATMDFYLGESGYFDYMGKGKSGGQSTDIKISKSEIRYFTSSSGTKVNGTIEEGKWYRLTVDAQVKTVNLDADCSTNQMTFTITDLSDNSQIATATASFRNASNGLKDLYLTSTNNSTVTNFSTWFTTEGFTRTIGTNGLATVCAPHNLVVPEGVTVYSVAVEGEGLKATATEATVIPANTGVIVKAAAGSEPSFKATADNGEAIASCLTAAPAGHTAAEGENIYALLKDQNVFAKVNTGVALAANTAYYAPASAAKSFTLSFDDETNAVSNVKAAASDNAPVFNIMGQRIAQPAKGLYIKNGKKFINK